MSLLNEFKTIPQLFKVATNGKNIDKNKTVLKQKVDGVYHNISYQTLFENTELIAHGLLSLGVKRGDKVSIISENRPEWAYSDFAILGIGGVDVPLYPILTSDSIEFILNDSGSVGIVVSNQFQLNKVLKIWDKCRSLRFIIVMNDIQTKENENIFTFADLKKMGEKNKSEIDYNFADNLDVSTEDDLCTIIYTSGTTGTPKGVLLTHKNIVSNVKAAHEVFEIDESDLFLSFLPLCHIFERMAGYYVAIAAGAPIAYAESIEKISQNLLEIKPTLMTAVPRLFERMYSKIKRNVESQSEKKQKIFNWACKIGTQYFEEIKTNSKVPFSLKSKYKVADKLVFGKLRDKLGGNLRFIISGGAPLMRELGEFFEMAGILIIEGYGLTESSPVITANRLNDYKFGTVGKTLPGVEVKIAKDGEILAFGPNIMKGYFNNKKETESTLKDGWLHTGDIGVFDAEGFLIITDRKKHLFKTSGGKYIAPAPIENLFLGSKFIDQFVLIGDRRMFLSALIVPDFEALKEYADAHRIQYSDSKDLIKMKQIYDLLQKDLTEFQKKLANFEKIRKFTLLEKPFSIESGELTPKLSIKRKIVEERYSDLIEDMYKGLER